MPGGSVEHMNEEPGAGLARARHPHLSGLRLAQSGAGAALGATRQSIRMMRQLMSGRMYPLTLEGLDRAMRELVR